MMAALDAAGFDPTPEGEEPSFFRSQVRKDQQGLDPELRQRLVTFYERNKLKAEGARKPTAGEQAARYVSLAYALGPAPDFAVPARAEDLPGGLLEVLDFAPLLREFYRKSGIDERLPAYLRSYQAEGEGLRRSTAEMTRSVISYLHTRPVTTVTERVPVRAPAAGRKKNEKPEMVYTTREHERRFVIVPDLLAAPGAFNFRVIGDDYFVVVPYCSEATHSCAGRGANMAAPELRRAYLQYVLDPLVMRFNRDIAQRREQLKQLLDKRVAAGARVSPDVFLAVARSLVAAADSRLKETARLDALVRETRARLDSAKETERAAIAREMQETRAAITDEAIAELAEAYENGAVLDFYFAEQLRGVESSGFDVSNLFADMIASFDPARELSRLEENDPARRRALAARKARQAQADAAAAEAGANAAAVNALPNAALVKKLLEVDDMVRLKNYAAAETRLLSLLREFPGEPRIFFALGETASRAAREATDEDVQSERLNRALANYRNAVRNATAGTDRGLLTRAHEAMGRILEFLEQRDEALREFDAAIQIGETSSQAYRDAVEGKKRLAQQK
jgi:hypothetical protein